MSSGSSSPSSTSIGSASRTSLSDSESESDSERSEPLSDFTDTRKLRTAAMVLAQVAQLANKQRRFAVDTTR